MPKDYYEGWETQNCPEYLVESLIIAFISKTKAYMRIT